MNIRTSMMSVKRKYEQLETTPSHVNPNFPRSVNLGNSDKLCVFRGWTKYIKSYPSRQK